MMVEKLVLAGATGLIGGAAVRLLATSDFDVHIIVRQETQPIDGITAHVAPVAIWPALVADLGAQTAISCLGTTMRQAGSQAAFGAIDLELVRAFASAAKAGGAKHFIAVSSVGANTQSANFYLKTKGQMESAVRVMDFERSDFLRPGLLRGVRGGERRFGERLGIVLSPLTDMLMMGPLRRYQSILADDVAKSICQLALNSGSGSHIHENVEIEMLATEYRRSHLTSLSKFPVDEASWNNQLD
jgi:uncharacterized protein YbjT (DUF2867 family)